MNPEDDFLKAAVWHGPLEPAAEILAAHPEIAGASIYTAALLGDDEAVRGFLDADPGSSTAKGGAHGWDALTYLCFSNYLRLDSSRSEALLRAAEALLDAGADAKTGFWEQDHIPEPEWESVLYGAAGVAHNAPLTRLLLEHGADPNDNEVPYHSPEGYDSAAMQVLVDSGKVTADNLAVMLLRKHDWHDLNGVRWLLDRGVDPNHVTHWRITPFDQAVRRDNDIKIIEALLDHGGHAPVGLAARRGRGDVLGLLEKRGIPIQLDGLDRLLAACAQGRDPGAPDPAVLAELHAQGGKILAEFAGNDSVEGVRRLLDLGIRPDVFFAEGDGYWDEAPNSTALHVAAWRFSHDTVKLLLSRGAPVNARDAKGRTPLMMAVKACIDSYWSRWRVTDSIEALLTAGADRNGVPIPSGYPEADTLLQA